MNVALYCRVSTEEQAKHGLSIDAQLKELKEYAKNKSYNVVGEYLDEGYSGGTLKRPALQQLLEDIKEHKIKTIIFVKLDRWFRSVADYYKIQEILEENNVEWIATQEDYETVTSSGKFKVNIMLSVSQQFKDATSERINNVFDYKIKVLKTVISGGKIFGYDIINKKYVINKEEAEIIRELYNKYLETNSLNSTWLWWCDKYGKCLQETIRKRLKDKKYNGVYTYKGEEIEDYIPKIIDDDTFNEVQRLIKMNHKRLYVNKGRTYIFSGLVKCKHCNNNMPGTTTRSGNGKATKYYRCNKRYFCENNKYTSEKKIESYILEKLPLLVDLKIKQANNKQIHYKDKTPQIKAKIDNLQDLYINGMIDMEKYKNKYNELQEELRIEKQKNIPNTTTNLEALDILKNKDISQILSLLDEKNKMLFYKKIIDKIVIDKDGIINIELM